MANNLFDQINIRGYVDGWAKITIDLWKKELRKKRIGVTGDLEKSFEKEVRRKGADVAETVLKFKMYGRYRDMNVGNGLKAYERSTNKANRSDARRYGAGVSFVNRVEKKWYNKIKTAQRFRLGELLSQKASQNIIKSFNTTNNIKINMNG